jgi:hypothetical protein
MWLEARMSEYVMIANLLRRKRDAGKKEGQALASRLGEALARLPAPWTVLGNETTDRLPWVRYLVLHLDKGLALVDIASAKPQAAVTPLTTFFVGAGFTAFQRGYLPIIAVKAGKLDIAAMAASLDTAFRTVRCSLTVADWPETVVELLTTQSNLRLRRVNRGASPRAAAAMAAPPAAAEPILPAMAIAKPPITVEPIDGPPLTYRRRDLLAWIEEHNLRRSLSINER